MTIKVLVDTSVRSAAHILRSAPTEHTVKWGGTISSVSVGGMARKNERDMEHEKHVTALPTFNRLSIDKSVVLATYTELMFEDLRGQRRSTATIGDLLIGVEYLHLDAAVDRSYFGGISSNEMTSDSLRDFCERFLLNPAIETSKLPTHFKRRLPASMYANLCNVARFREICAHAPKKHFSDLFHLWTGEVNDCGYFLTMEKALPNFCESHCPADLRCKPIRPLDLLKTMGIEKLEPMPVEPGQKLTLFEAWDLSKYIN